MGTILARRRKHGGMAYMAKIILTRDKRVIHRESRTFETHKRAKDWIMDREAELAKPGELDRIGKPEVTLGDAIDRYIAESKKKIRRTKWQVLNAILEMPIARIKCDAIRSEDIISFAQALSNGRTPATVGNYMSHLAAIFAVAQPAWRYPLNRQAMEDARTVTSRLGISGKGKERDRRPTLEEIDKLMSHFHRSYASRPTATPMHKIIAFAIFSTRRQEEICLMNWADFEPDQGRVLIRDMKHPGQKDGNDTWCDMTQEAVAIAKSMPMLSGQIFPYSPDSISTIFTRACKFLEIEDLRFHDLRHEGISRLFEMGYRNGSIPHVALVSGHRSWKSLQRYTQIRQTGDKFAGWKWMDIATEPMLDRRLIKHGHFPRTVRSQRATLEGPQPRKP